MARKNGLDAQKSLRIKNRKESPQKWGFFYVPTRKVLMIGQTTN